MSRFDAPEDMFAPDAPLPLPMDDEEDYDMDDENYYDYYEPADVLYDERDEEGPFYDPQEGANDL